MALATRFASLALHSLAVAADFAGGETITRLCLGLRQVAQTQFGDHARRLLDALQQATERAWFAVEIALTDDSLRERLRSLLTRAEDRILAGQLQTFLATVPLGAFPDDAGSFRRKALAELRHARSAGLLAPGNDPAALEAAVGPFATYSDPSSLLEAQRAALEQLADQLHQQGYEYLAHTLKMQPADGQPLFLLAVRYFLRRALESDEQLFRSLALDQLGKIEQVHQAGLAALELALDLQGQRIQSLLGDIHETLSRTHDAVLDIHDQIAGQGEQLRLIGHAVQQLLAQHHLQRREIRPGDSLSIRSEDERQIVHQLVARYRAVPEKERLELPSLLNAVGKLQVVAGDFEEAQQAFHTVAQTVNDASLRAEAHHNAYRTALERRDYPAALNDFRSATRGDPRRFNPFPQDIYQPQRILGAGGFGVVFLCQHRYLSAPVVVKALWLGSTSSDASRVFSEARLLRELDHPAIIRITECGYADPERQERPYLVMDYFEGVTLEEYVRSNGPLSVDEYLVIARQIATGLQAAHARGILHRDIKPANLLVNKTDVGWEVKLIDFGLAMRQNVPELNGPGSTTRTAKTLLGHSIAGTLAYAAPEQLGHRDEMVGPGADIYAFARTSCQILFGTTTPLPRHWQRIPPVLGELLGECLEESPTQRPRDFGEVIARLGDRHPAAIPVLNASPEVPKPKPKPILVPSETRAVVTTTSEKLIDLETMASMVELLRIIRRMLRLNLFEVVGNQHYPHVARSDMGGYELPRPNRRLAERLHPARELVRLFKEQQSQGRTLDHRLVDQVGETVTQAQGCLAKRPPALVATGAVASGLLVLSPFFGLMIALTPVGSPGSVFSIVWCAITGAGALVLTILTLVQIGGLGSRRGFCHEVIESLESVLPEPKKATVEVWPPEKEGRTYLGIFLASVFVAIGLIIGIIAVGSNQKSQPARPRPVGPVKTEKLPTPPEVVPNGPGKPMPPPNRKVTSPGLKPK